MTRLRMGEPVGTSLPASDGRQRLPISSVDAFQIKLDQQQALTVRCCYHFSLLLLEVERGKRIELRRLAGALAKRVRSSDTVGWFDANHIGVILPRCRSNDARRLGADMSAAVGGRPSRMYRVHTFGSDSQDDTRGHVREPERSCCAERRASQAPAGASRNCRCTTRCARVSCEAPIRSMTHPQQAETHQRYPLPIWKRATDIAGAVLGLILLSPLFVAVGIFIKCVSKGPVFFKQDRVGYMGKTFRMWKFRTYEHNTDAAQHERYVTSLIAAAQQAEGEPQACMRKLDDAPGVIPFGKLLRKTCVDELPQLINVLLGDMSLVGPRPAITYEVAHYADWHHGRLRTIPGMTGLWQVSGKNRLTFNEMVRLDIRYSRQMSLWLDLKIVLKTPTAIISQMADSLRRRGQAGPAGPAADWELEGRAA